MTYTGQMKTELTPILLVLPWLAFDMYFFLMSVALMILKNRPITKASKLNIFQKNNEQTAILIPTFNNTRTILNKLLPQLTKILDSQENLPIAITLVDSSTDGTENQILSALNLSWGIETVDRCIAQRDNLTLIHLKNRAGGKSWALNKVVLELNTKYFAILDSGWILNFENFSKATQYLEENSEYVYAQMSRQSTGKALNFVGGIDQVSIEYRHQFENRIRAWQNIPVTIHGTAVVIRTKAFQAMHGFDDTVLSEDVDLAVRLMLNGQFGAALCDLNMQYDPCDHWRQFFWQKARWAEGRSQILRKYAMKIVHSPYISVKQKLFWIYYLSYFGRCVSFTLLLVLALYGIIWGSQILTHDCMFALVCLLAMRALCHMVTLCQHTNRVRFICRLLEPLSFYGIGLIYTYTFFIGLIRSKGTWRIVESKNYT